MTDLRKAAEMALEALGSDSISFKLKARVALRQALAHEQEFVAWDGDCVLGHCGSPAGCEESNCCRANYTAPPKQEWDGTLRDYFAAQAMQSLLMGGYEDLTKEYWDSIPNDAYAMADAMLKERMKNT